MKPVSRQVSRQLRKLSWFRRQSASAGLFKKGYSTPNDFNAETTRAIDEIQSCVNDVRNSDIGQGSKMQQRSIIRNIVVKRWVSLFLTNQTTTSSMIRIISFI